MKIDNLLIILGFTSCVVQALEQDGLQSPGCALSCWENSKYVSKCGDETSCLCNEADFQNTVFKCLYSQCSTAQFGPALHRAISQCTSEGHDFFSVHPPLIRHDGLRKKREFDAEQRSGSILISGSATYPTQSVGSGLGPTTVLKGPFFTPTFSPEDSAGLLPFVASANTAAAENFPSALGIVATATPGPELYTGFASSLAMGIGCPIIVTVTAFVLSM